MYKIYESNSFEEALKQASNDNFISIDEAREKAKIIFEKKSLFNSYIKIGFFDENDVYEYCLNYLKNLIRIIKAQATYSLKYNDDEKLITIQMSSDNGSQLIGKHEVNLRSLNTLVRSAAFNKFGNHYHVLLDCNNYKEVKYEKIRMNARSSAEDVLKTHFPSIFPPMTADERRVVHEELKGIKDLCVESVDNGNKRHIVITYKSGNVTSFGDKK